MPELPEVETIVRELRTGLVGARITDIKKSAYALRQPVPNFSHLKGKSILDIQRRAKYILFCFDDGKLVSHLGMTGKWVWSDNGALDKHDHLSICLETPSGTKFLKYNDARRFGLLVWQKEGTEGKWQTNLGPEPLEVWTDKEFKDALSRRTLPIKQAIMDNKIVVGVGNIYASEALFVAKIHPKTPAKFLSSSDVKRLHDAIISVLKKGIKAKGASIKNYRRTDDQEGRMKQWLLVYGQSQNPCPSCKTLIQSEFLGGRNTFWCPSCQKLPKTLPSKSAKNQRNFL